jgi:hypothetical protein
MGICHPIISLRKNVVLTFSIYWMDVYTSADDE